MSETPYRLGLTGSIAMGKTTTAGFFQAAGVPVWDADKAVDTLYGPDGAGVPAIAALVPQAVSAGQIDREALKAAIGSQPGLLQRVEEAIHPLVAQDRQKFLATQQTAGVKLVVFDIPLLFETGAEASLDGVLVVTAPPEIQRNRALSRPDMTEAHFQTLLARQMPDTEKRKRADYIIDTARGLDAARADALSLLAKLDHKTHA